MILLNERQSLHFTINDLIIFKEEEIALSNEGTAQELRQIQVLIHQTLNFFDLTEKQGGKAEQDFGPSCPAGGRGGGR